MRVNEIEVGGIYHDGKSGIRVVVECDAFERATYRTLAAHSKSVINNVCDIEVFAKWARTRITEEDSDALVAVLPVNKKLIGG